MGSHLALVLCASGIFDAGGRSVGLSGVLSNTASLISLRCSGCELINNHNLCLPHLRPVWLEIPLELCYGTSYQLYLSVKPIGIAPKPSTAKVSPPTLCIYEWRCSLAEAGVGIGRRETGNSDETWCLFARQLYGGGEDLLK